MEIALWVTTYVELPLWEAGAGLTFSPVRYAPTLHSRPQDRIQLLLNPVISVAAAVGVVHWNLGFSGSTAIPYELPVAYLKDPNLIPASERVTLNQAGITNSDLQTMLALDPLATLTHLITEADLDPHRFSKVLTFAYEPTVQSSSCNGGVCTCTQVKNTLTNSFNDETTNTVNNTASQSYSVSASFSPISSGSVTVTGPNFAAGFSDVHSIAFTSTATTSNSRSKSSSASVVVACASTGWTGQTLVDVFWDGVFGSFAFVLRDLVSSERLLAVYHVRERSSTANFSSQLTTTALPSMPKADLYYADQKLTGILNRNGELRFYGRPVPNASAGVLRIEGTNTVEILQVQK